MDKTKSELASAERRNFLKLTSAGSFTAALVAGAGGMLWSDQAVAQTAAEEREREAARHDGSGPIDRQDRADGA